jgi:O-antigen/teichoic acid export membrane protein
LSRTANGAVGVLASRLAGQGASFLSAVLVSRALGPSGRGTFAYTVTLLGIILVTTSGHPGAVAWQYAKRLVPIEAVRTSMNRLVLFASGIGAIAMFALYRADGTTDTSVLVVAVTIPFAVYAQSASGVFLANAEMAPLAFQQLITTVVTAALFVALFVTGVGNIAAYMLCWCSAYVVCAAFTAYYLRRMKLPEARAGVSGRTREQALFAAKLCLNGVATYLNLRVDVFIIMFVLGRSELGVYSVGIAIAEALWQMSRSVAAAVLSRVARGGKEDAARLTAKAARISLSLGAVGAIAIAAVVHPIVVGLFGQSFSAAIPVTLALLPGVVLYSAMPAISQFFSQQVGEPKIPLAVSVTSTVLCAVITALTVRRYGLMAGAIATSISYGVSFCVSLVYFGRETSLRPLDVILVRRSDFAPYLSRLDAILHPQV